LPLVIFRKGGEPGEVAVNPERVTHVRTASGPFTDIWFGDTRVAVEGSFQQVIARLNGIPPAEQPAAPKNWFPARQ
jgi:hypothetical protein